jgi:hypothetical protein
MTELVLTGISQPWVIELRPGLNRLGRNPTNDFRIAEVSVSGFHCEITMSEDATTVRDLGSTNGTFIDGEPIQESVIRTGQVLRLGRAELRLETQLPTVAIPPLSPPPQAVVQTYLPDGAAACLNHPGRAANYKCTHCEHPFCRNCVRVLGLAGGQSMVFCPSCNARCDPLAERAPEETSPEPVKKPSFFGRLTETLKLPFKH